MKENLFTNYLILRPDDSRLAHLDHVMADQSQVLHRGATVLAVGRVEGFADEGLAMQYFGQWKVLKDQADYVCWKVVDSGGA